jgi:hypothetical protein
MNNLAENYQIYVNEKDAFVLHVKEWLPGSLQIYHVLAKNLSWDRQIVRRSNYCGMATRCQLLAGNRGIQSKLPKQDMNFIDWNIPGSPIAGVRQLSEVLWHNEIVQNVNKNFKPTHCVLNHYTSGDDHTCYKNIKTKVECLIALGADRKFSLKHKESGKIIDISLKSGDLLITIGCSAWKSSMTKMPKTKEGHISLCYA